MSEVRNKWSVSKAAQNKFNPKKLVPDITLAQSSVDSEECFTTGASQNGVSPESAAAISSMIEDSDSQNGVSPQSAAAISSMIEDSDSKDKGGTPRLTDPRSIGPDLKTFVINF